MPTYRNAFRVLLVLVAIILSVSMGMVGSARAELTLPPDVLMFLSSRLTLIKWVQPDTYSSDEFAAWAQTFWEKFDRDGDGVTPDEVEYRMLEEPAQKDNAGWERYHKKRDVYLTSEYMQAFHLDPDQDGTVTLEEIADMARTVFAFADEDRDGGFSTKEKHRLVRAIAYARYEHCTESGCSWE